MRIHPVVSAACLGPRKVRLSQAPLVYWLSEPLSGVLIKLTGFESSRVETRLTFSRHSSSYRCEEHSRRAVLRRGLGSRPPFESSGQGSSSAGHPSAETRVRRLLLTSNEAGRWQSSRRRGSGSFAFVICIQSFACVASGHDRTLVEKAKPRSRLLRAACRLLGPLTHVLELVGHSNPHAKLVIV